MKWLRRSLLVTATVGAVVVATGGAAYAGTDATARMTGARVQFISYGDKFKVCDTEADLWIVYNEYKYVRKDGTLQHDREYNQLGSGTCVTYDHDFGEGRTVTFRACLDLPSVVPDSCTDWEVGIA